MAVWACNQVTNTDRNVRIGGLLAADPAVQQAIADQITTEIFTSSTGSSSRPKSRHKQHGQRVVDGQRMMAASDIYLGWTKGVDVTRHYY